MKRLLFAGGVVLALAASPAHAQAVVTCTNCSTSGQQLIDYGKQIQQLANEIQTATNTLNTYTTLVQNTISLPRSLYADITNTVNQLEALRNQASLLTGNSGLILSNLSSRTFPVVNMQTELTTEMNALSNAMQKAGQQLNSQPSTLNQQSSQQTTFVGQANSGTTQAVQAGNQASATNAQTSAANQSTVTGLLQAQLTAQIVQEDRVQAANSLTNAQIAGGYAAACSVARSGGLTVSWC
jgi:P-type conjugative transfer protein TrbJ